MMNGFEFIQATDGKQYYMESFLKSIIYGYNKLVESKLTYSRSQIHEIIKEIQKSDKAHNEVEDYLCTDLVSNYIKPNLGVFGLSTIVVDNGVRETKNNVTVGHLDIKFQIPSLSNNYYFAFEAKRLDKNQRKQNYYIDGGIKRFTDRVYYPETNTVLAGMIGFVEMNLNIRGSRVALHNIKDSINSLISTNVHISTTQPLTDYFLTDETHNYINDFKTMYLSKHTRKDDNAELKIFHVFLDYYDLLKN